MTDSRTNRRDHGVVTAQDVADQAGVSLTTVSRSFGDASLVSKPTRERVLRIASQLGYSPNIAARVLAGRQSNLIGLLVNNFDDPEHLDLFRFVSAEAQKCNYHALLLNISHERSELQSVDTALQHQVDGLLVAASHLPEELAKRCALQNKPMVIVGRKSQRPDYTSVYCDNRAGAALVAEQMFNEGVVRPAFIGGKPEATVTRERMAGFVNRIEGLYGFQPITRNAGVNEYESGFATAAAMMGLPKPPDGFFCSSDLLAVALLDAIATHQESDTLQKPLVYGFGQTMLSRLNAYNFLSVSMPFESMVRKATSQLIEQINEKNPNTQDIVLPCNLNVAPIA